MRAWTCTRRQWLLGSLATAVGLGAEAFGKEGRGGGKKAEPHPRGKKVPITGPAEPGLGKFDEIMVESLRKHRIPGAALCLAAHGRLVLARGYGWADLQAAKPVQPDMLFGIGSVSKTITAAAVLKLVENGKLTLEARAFQVLPLKPLEGHKEDPRVHQITVRQLLNHSSGYGETTPTKAAAKAFGVSKEEVTPDQIIRYRLGQPLEYTPGTQARYSNYAFMVLGQIVEHVSGTPYPQFVKEKVLAPMGIRHAAFGTRSETYPPHWAHRYDKQQKDLGPLHPTQAGAAGIWVTSAVELARFLTGLTGARGPRFLSPAMMKQMLAPPPPPLKPKKNGSHFGLGWDTVVLGPHGAKYSKNGGLPGIRAFMGHMPGGVDWAFVFNGGSEDTHGENAELAGHVQKEIEKRKTWPKGNFFPRFRG